MVNDMKNLINLSLLSVISLTVFASSILSVEATVTAQQDTNLLGNLPAYTETQLVNNKATFEPLPGNPRPQKTVGGGDRRVKALEQELIAFPPPPKSPSPSGSSAGGRRFKVVLPSNLA